MKSKNLLEKNIFLLLFCLFSASLFAQNTPPPKQWDKRFGGSDYEMDDICIRQTSDGGYILSGNSVSGISGDKTENCRGKVDNWIVKIDANGIKQWDKRFGGSDDDYCHSIEQTTDGGYIIVGESSSGISGDKSEDCRGLSDYWVIKIDANGIKQWDKRFGGSSYDRCFSVKQTGDGGYILGGWSMSGISGDKTAESRGFFDYWLLKIDANGIKQWDKGYGGSSLDYCNALQLTSDGGYILGGSSFSSISGEVTETNRGYDDFWVIKLDSNGIKQWDKRFGGSYYDECFALQQTTDGGYILGGWSYSRISGDKTEDDRGERDYWAVKIDSIGNKQWDKRFGGSNSDVCKSIQQTIDGGYILGGVSSSRLGYDKTEDTRGIFDYWAVKIDSLGNKQWDKRFGGSKNEPSCSIYQTIDGGYVLGGISESKIEDDKTQASRGLLDYWVVKMGCPSSAKVAPLGNLDICHKDSVVLIADYSPGVQYQWLKEGIKIEGATKRRYTATEPGIYKVVVFTDRECSNVSRILNVTNSCKTNKAVSLSSNNKDIQPFALEMAEVWLSPNPSKGNINLRYSCAIPAKIQLNVFDINGKNIFTKMELAKKGNNSYQLNLSMLASGVYTLQLINGSEIKKIMFLINH